MFTSLFKRSSECKTDQKQKRKYPIVKTGHELLSTPERQIIIRQLKRLFSTTESGWADHYLYAIEKFCELVQELPASEIHHHSQPGGLIDHTLETLHSGVRIALGYVLPPNAEPEEIASATDRWRYGVFIAILSHDAGKVLTDIEVVFRNTGESFQLWHPWFGNLPKGAEYSYRYRARVPNKTASKTMHEQAAMSFLPKLLTKKAAAWLFEDMELVASVFGAVTHSGYTQNVIREIVRKADGSSVSANLGAETGTVTSHSSSIPLHEKLMVSLRKLVNDGDLKRNRPGAAIWVTDSDTWAVSKAVMEAVKVQLQQEGHKGIPNSPVRLFEVLREHELIVPTSEGDSVWSAEVNDYAKNWQQKLTFIRFKNDQIWVNQQPDYFDGKVTPLDRAGRAAVAPIISKEKEDGETAQAQVEEVVNRQNEELKQDVSQKPSTEYQKAETETEKQDIGVSSKEAIEQWVSPKRIKQETLMENDFISWLVRGITRRQIRVNEPKAPVHVLDHHIALVTPAIFILYLEKNSLKKKLYEKRSGDKRSYTLIQKEIESLEIHQRSSHGQNIVRMTVEGQRTRSELKVYLLNRDFFPSLSNFNPNKAMRIHL